MENHFSNNKNVLKETRKGNVMTATTNVLKNNNTNHNEENTNVKYVMPPSKRVRSTFSNNEKNNSTVETTVSVVVETENVENVLTQPEMGQDFDPYGETLITY